MAQPEFDCFRLWLGGKCSAFNDSDGAATAFAEVITTVSHQNSGSHVAQASQELLEIMGSIFDEASLFLKNSYNDRINHLSRFVASPSRANMYYKTIRCIRAQISDILAGPDIDSDLCFAYSTTHPHIYSLLSRVTQFTEGTAFEPTTVTFPSLESSFY